MTTDKHYHALETSKLWQGTKRIAKVLAAKKNIPLVQYIDALVKMDEAETKEMERRKDEMK